MPQYGKGIDKGQYERVLLSFLDAHPWSLFMRLGKQASEGKASPCSADLLWKPLHQCQKSLSVRKVAPLIQRRKIREEGLGSPEELDLIPVRSLGIKRLEVSHVSRDKDCSFRTSRVLDSAKTFDHYKDINVQVPQRSTGLYENIEKEEMNYCKRVEKTLIRLERAAVKRVGNYNSLQNDGKLKTNVPREYPRQNEDSGMQCQNNYLIGSQVLARRQWNEERFSFVDNNVSRSSWLPLESSLLRDNVGDN
ncbi:hypothetical protein DUI87_11430 [Hirundo rustica rustica]|uniref:Uncharacterized protein n=1 Tax=Hirundo rustica rustica TaxID=333673 RepID=A0A3M0KFF6_HIRRU|nr:hypothetical protein DUI87_11430 [Hirundo rustica rustica]